MCCVRDVGWGEGGGWSRTSGTRHDNTLFVNNLASETQSDLLETEENKFNEIDQRKN